jgi:hypothetical protein
MINYLNTGYIFQKIYDIFNGKSLFEILQIILQYILAFLNWLWPFSIIISLIFLVGIVYSLVRIGQIREEEKKEREEAERIAVETPKDESPKWARILKLVESDSDTDWRMAILEADILLEEMVRKMGYRGETLGDMLKSIEKSDFTSINDAWEAHNARNAIAHEGTNFFLDKRKVKRVIQLYATVFKEFKFI